ncbi:CheF family chemotaxis protein [Candidatus Halobonum tyrrellensis]|uniref:Taxis protein CheF n=1 Tax=Candidatus Halobonum tyrrellensis G22 TaxID=1324957 RepID=V4J2C4_9EURY|nr:CheF family chemotaxis protein [Candidatus Halobonum tyrrellensis]ESP89562.1 hypothetical protein K933_03360 [Candidatus Halobonum tyrrellensis G22]
MTESVVADFVGRFVPPGGGNEPSSGRIVLSQRRLVLAADDDRVTIPLSAVFDVTVKQVPPQVTGYFNDTVTVAYRDDDTRRLVAIEGSNDNIDRFVTVLFKVLLNGTTVRLHHPAKVGGRVTDATTSQATLSLSMGSIAFDRDDETVSVDLDDVIAVEREERDFGNGARPVVSFRHVADGRAVTSEVGLPSGRKTNLLGRYIRLRYADAKAELEEFDPNEAELEVLVALYTAGSDVSLPAVVDIDPQRLTMLLNGLADEGVVVDTVDGTELTPKGRIVVGQRLESVNT